MPIFSEMDVVHLYEFRLDDCKFTSRLRSSNDDDITQYYPEYSFCEKIHARVQQQTQIIDFRSVGSSSNGYRDLWVCNTTIAIVCLYPIDIELLAKQFEDFQGFGTAEPFQFTLKDYQIFEASGLALKLSCYSQKHNGKLLKQVIPLVGCYKGAYNDIDKVKRDYLESRTKPLDYVYQASWNYKSDAACASINSKTTFKVRTVDLIKISNKSSQSDNANSLHCFGFGW